MQVKEVIEYLKAFPKDEDIRFIVVDIQNRMKYDAEVFGISDAPVPVFAIEIGNPKSFTEEERKAAEECENE